MCPPIVGMIASGASTMIQMSAQEKQAKAQKEAADDQAKRIELDRKVGEVQAMQNQRNRFEDYISAEKSNLAVFSASGIDTESMSIKAFEEANKATVVEDLSSIAFQADYESSSKRVQAASLRKSGSNALSAGYVNMMGTAATGIYNMSQIWPSSTATIKPIYPKTSVY